MTETLTLLLLVFLSLAALVCLFYVLWKMFQEKGFLHALLGFLFPIYPYFWGWLHGSRLRIYDVMIFWTLITVISVIFPLALGVTTGLQAFQSGPAPAPDFVGGSDTVQMGTISRGQLVQGRIEDLFEIQSWTFDGAAGEAVTIRSEAIPGDSTDPRISLYGPDGTLWTGDDDGGGGTVALINGFILPQNGTYRIEVDVWTTGGYMLTLE